MTTNPPAMVLEANFDIDQTGETLEWHFARSDGDGNPDEGKDAGSIKFVVGEKMFVRVTGGSKTPYTSFKVLDCCLITQPQIVQCGKDIPTLYAAPSLFVKGEGHSMGASIKLAAEKFEPRQVQPDPAYFTITQVWGGHLKVGDDRGRWELSFIITVLITRADGSSYPRVFNFDPECEVGPGI